MQSWICRWMVGLSLMMSASLYAAEAPDVMLEQAATHMMQTLKANQTRLKTDPHWVEGAVREYLLPHVDVTGMSRSVLGRQAWNQATLPEREAFSKAFTALVIRTYAAPLSHYAGETITFSHDVASDGKFAHVQSLIVRPNGQRIPLMYALVLKEDTWKVYDLSIEGVSLLQSFRNQFSQALQESNMNTLISKMKQQESRV